MSPLPVEHDPQRSRCRDDHRIERGSGSPKRAASSRARGSSGRRPQRHLSSKRARTLSTRACSSSLFVHAGTRTTSTPSVMRAETVFSRLGLRITRTGGRFGLGGASGAPPTGVLMAFIVAPRLRWALGTHRRR